MPLLALLALLAMNGCGVFTDDTAARETERELALQRWHRCISRSISHGTGQVPPPSGNPGATLAIHGLRVTNNCEGHERDVIASYPPHLANRIARKLSEHQRSLYAAHLQRSDERPMLNKARFEIEARQGDL
ncbi:MAG: hypothetical protein CSB44_06220 [Gammaproteobacteria bacterium]|nr:MAG: hypothetical protein CSB44_06220 [Gammaproteobacteria bacterium]